MFTRYKRERARTRLRLMCILYFKYGITNASLWQWCVLKHRLFIPTISPHPQDWRTVNKWNYKGMNVNYYHHMEQIVNFKKYKMHLWNFTQSWKNPRIKKLFLFCIIGKFILICIHIIVLQFFHLHILFRISFPVS